MTKNPAISIIVPVYNVERYLARCIDSIINQTYKDWELILVNDGSTDKSQEICDKYRRTHQNIRILNSSRGGVSKARNSGIEAAKGDYLYFVDSDDYLSPTHLAQYADVMNDYDITFQGYRLFDNDTDETIKTCHAAEMDTTAREMQSILCQVFECGNQFGSAWSKIFRRDIIDKWHIRFKENISIREDEVFAFEYCQYVKTVKVLDTTTYNYRMTPNSLMRRKYMNPQEMLNAFDASYQAALQIPQTAEFRTMIDTYYRDSLRWAYWMLYHTGKLADVSFRMRYYDVLADWDEKHPEMKTHLIKGSIRISDYWQLVKYAVKVMIKKK